MFQQILRSIFPEPLLPRTEAQRKRFPLKNLVLHFRPATVPQKTMRLSLTWGLGGMAFVLVALLLGTGLLLKFYYLPSPEKAYESVLYLQNTVLFGRLIRNIHHWSANLGFLLMIAHMLRVMFTGAFRPPRIVTYLVGLVLLFAAFQSFFNRHGAQVGPGRL